MATLRLNPKPIKKKVEPEKSKRERANDILNELQSWRDYLPLPVGIRCDIQAYVAERDARISLTAIRRLMYHHCIDRRYIECAVMFKLRFNPIDGTIETMTDKHHRRYQEKLLQLEKCLL